MNDIEILKEHCVETHNTHKICFTYNDEERIWSLIQRNKDLEQIEKEHKEENGRLRDRTKELEGIYNTAYNMGKSYINIKWKSKIKEKIEELNKEEKKALKGTKGQDRYSIKLEYMHKRNALQELLEESDK